MVEWAPLVGFGSHASDVYLQANSSGDLTIGIVGDPNDSIFVHSDLTALNGTVTSKLSRSPSVMAQPSTLTKPAYFLPGLDQATTTSLIGQQPGFERFRTGSSNDSVNFTMGC